MSPPVYGTQLPVKLVWPLQTKGLILEFGHECGQVFSRWDVGSCLGTSPAGPLALQLEKGRIHFSPQTDFRRSVVFDVIDVLAVLIVVAGQFQDLSDFHLQMEV